MGLIVLFFNCPYGPASGVPKTRCQNLWRDLWSKNSKTESENNSPTQSEKLEAQYTFYPSSLHRTRTCVQCLHWPYPHSWTDIIYILFLSLSSEVFVFWTTKPTGTHHKLQLPARHLIRQARRGSNYFRSLFGICTAKPKRWQKDWFYGTFKKKKKRLILFSRFISCV